MLQLGYLAIANAMLATVFALLLWCVRSRIRQAALLHLLWILVLVRLVMPPVFVFHVTDVGTWLSELVPQQATARAVAIVKQATSRQKQVLAMVQHALERSDLVPRITLQPGDQPEEDELSTFIPIANTVNFGKAAVAWARYVWTYLSHHGSTLLILWMPFWFVGTVCCGLIQLSLGLRFRRRLRRDGYTSRIWQTRTQRIARRMGLRRCPEVLLVRATISPMLWGFGSRTRLLFPERLIESLDAESQDTLLAHELAHFRRGDQWVRLLELFVTALFWWHPVVWWARHHIEAAEEECCDAWAVSQSNGCPRKYAEALLTTVDFVSVGLPSLPPAASGVGGGLLRQRLTAIMRGTAHRRSLSANTYAGVWILAACLLIPCPALWQELVEPLSRSVESAVAAPRDLPLSLDVAAARAKGGTAGYLG